MGRLRAVLLVLLVGGCGGDGGDGGDDRVDAGAGAAATPPGGEAGDGEPGAGSLLLPVGTDGPPRLRAVAGDGSAGRDVLVGVGLEDVDRSPDGRRLAVVLSDPARAEGAVAVLDAPTLREERRFPPGEAATRVAWSPSGRWLAITVDPGTPPTKERPQPTGEVHVVASAGGEPRAVGAGDRVAWSPDETRIAVDGPDGVEVLDLDGGARQLLAAGGGAPPAWSPDGLAIAHLSSSGELAVVPATGGAPLVHGPAGGSPTWSVDGWLAAPGQGTEVLVVDPDGGRHDLAHVPSMPGSTIACVAWSPDGRSLAVADLGAVDAYERAGGAPRRLFEPGWPEGPGCPVQWRGAPLGAGPGVG